MTPNDNTHEIVPALTPDEWADVGSDDRDVRHLLSCYADGLDNLADLGATRRDEAACRHVTVALANHALPDSDPRKLTDSMALAMTQAAHFLENANGELSTHWPDGANPWHQLAANLRRHAATIRALLPPR